MAIENSQDVSLFNMIHGLLDQQAEVAGFERRQHERHAYHCTQLLAPFDGKRRLTQTDFRLVHCRDLSSTGFSFFAPRAPKFRFVVVALGVVPFKFFKAEIVRISEDEVDGEVTWVVGCKFTERIE